MDKKTLDFIKNNPVFFSRLGFCYDPPLKDVDGKPLVFSKNFEKYKKFHTDFCNAGVNIHTSILHSGWVGTDEYDYSLADKVLETVFSYGDDVYYIPRIKLNPPIEWCRDNPEELFVYNEGPRTKEEIRSLVGTLKQDYLGYESGMGYYRADEYVDNRPNVGGLISLQSFSSKKWQKDAAEALRRLIDRIENSKYADRVIGYHLAYGACGETVLWGRTSCRYGDYGIANRRAFFEWGVKKYGSAEKLAEVWGQKGITAENIIIPAPEERTGKTDSFADFMRTGKKDTICIDYDIFSSDVNTDALLHFAKTAKASGKPVGSFYGYFMHIDNAAYTGHLGLEKLLNRPYIDFFAAPKSYYRSGYGQPGGEMCPAQSVNRKKLWLDELDNRTHLATEVLEGLYCSKTEKDTMNVMVREFSKNMAHGSGFWWMDLGGGWFDDTSLMNEIHKLVLLNNKMRAMSAKSVADVLVVVDERSALYMRANHDLRCGFVEDFLSEMQMSGVIFDTYRAADLESLDLSAYKLVIFAYCEYMDCEWYRDVKNRLNPNTVVMFNYASGLHCKDGFDLGNAERIMGCSLCLTENPSRYDFPQLKAVGNSANGKCVYNMKPYMRHSELAEIAKSANCHIYTDDDGTVLYGDSRFLAVFNTTRDSVKIKPLRPTEYCDVFTGKVYEKSEVINLDISENACAFLMEKE